MPTNDSGEEGVPTMAVSDDNAGIRVAAVPRCFLCGTMGEPLHTDLADPTFGVPGRWNLSRCPQCGLVWLNPCPIPEEIGKLYQTYYTHGPMGALNPILNLVKRGILATAFGYRALPLRPIERVAGHVLRWVRPVREMIGWSVKWLTAVPGGRLLDVGAGSGLYMDQMRMLGWDVAGVEPDAAAIAVAKERFGLTLHQGVVEDALADGTLAPDAFDAIVLVHVIEHLSDSIGTLRACAALLKPGGRLVIVTPNTTSLGHRWYGGAWRGCEPPRHRQIFSPRTLTACVEQAGLRAVRTWTSASAARFLWPPSHLTYRTGSAPLETLLHMGWQLRLRSVAFQLLESLCCLFRDAGEEVITVATK